MFKVKDISLKSQDLGKHIKILSKLGKTKPLFGDVSFKDFTVFFDQYDVDATVEYEMCFTINFINRKKVKQEVMYDCVRMVTAMNFETELNPLHIHIVKHEPLVNDELKSLPYRNNIKMTSNQYREFLEDFSLSSNYFKKWLNTEVLRGPKMNLPFTFDEFDLKAYFEYKKMTLMVGVEDKAYKFLEE